MAGIGSIVTRSPTQGAGMAVGNFGGVGSASPMGPGGAWTGAIGSTAGATGPGALSGILSKIMSPNGGAPQPGQPIPGTLGVYSGGPANLPKVPSAGSSAPPQSGGAPTNPTLNAAAPNPVSNEIIDILKNRAKGDMGLPGQLDRATQDIRDNASMGIAGEQALSRARRGVSGTGIDQMDADKLAKAQQQGINRVTTDLTLGRERDRDALYGSIAGLGLQQGSQQLSQQQLGLQQQAQADARASDAWQREATMASLASQSQYNNLQALINLLT